MMDLSSVLSTADKYSALITAAATAVLAILTWAYISEIRKERRIRTIEHLSNSVLNPLASTLRKEICKLEENYYILQIKTKNGKPSVFLDNFSSTSYLNDFSYSIYKNTLPWWKRRGIEKYKKAYEEAIGNLEGQICDFALSIPENFDALVISFEEEFGRGGGGSVTQGGPRDEAFKMLEFIIQRRDTLDHGNIYKKFWGKYRDKIKSELYKNKKIEKKIDEIEKEKNKVIKVGEEYEKAIGNLLKELVNKYGIVIK